MQFKMSILISISRLLNSKLKGASLRPFYLLFAGSNPWAKVRAHHLRPSYLLFAGSNPWAKVKGHITCALFIFSLQAATLGQKLGHITCALFIFSLQAVTLGQKLKGASLRPFYFHLCRQQPLGILLDKYHLFSFYKLPCLQAVEIGATCKIHRAKFDLMQTCVFAFIDECCYFSS